MADAMPQNEHRTTSFDNVRTLVLSGAIGDLKLITTTNSPDERVAILARFERATAMVNWDKLQSELAAILQEAQS